MPDIYTGHLTTQGAKDLLEEAVELLVNIRDSLCEEDEYNERSRLTPINTYLKQEFGLEERWQH